MSRQKNAALALGLLLACACNEKSKDEARPANASAQEGTLPRLAQVPEFSLTNQKGVPFGSKELLGKAYVAAFMFTRCPTVCPRLTARMKELAEAAEGRKQELQLVSFSVDGEYDTPPVLTEYARKHGAERPNWYFLTGNFQQIAKTAEEGFKIGVSGTVTEGAPHLGITHGSHLVLVDASGNIRGYYRSFDDDTVTRLLDDLKRL